MLSKFQTRREFLVRAGAALGGAAAATQLHSEQPRLTIDPFGSDETAAPPPRLRGLMVDAGRVPEKLDYYRRVIDFCSEWQLNALQFRLADDQGCAIRFSSAPDLLFHPNAFTPDQLHDLAQYAAHRSVDLIPELESFGHTGYITRAPKYAHLLDAESPASSEFTGVIPVHPETLELFNKLYGEAASIFPSPFLHGGCDEVNWGGSELSRQALLNKPRYRIWAEYLNSLDRIAASLGKQFIVWGDFVLHKEPRILERLNKRIVVMDWNYTETDPAKIRQALATVRSHGCRAIGAPALINWRWGPRAGASQLANIDAFADAYLHPRDAGSLGVILTNWVPCRYIQNSIWDGFAYAAVAFNEGSGTAQNSGFRDFVKKHYGTNWNGDWDEAFKLIYADAPEMGRAEAAAGSPVHLPLIVPWNNDDRLRAVFLERLPQPNPFSRLRTLLDQLASQVIKNKSDFRAFALSVEYFEHLYWRESAVAGLAAGARLTIEDAGRVMNEIAKRDRNVAGELSIDWDEGRFADSLAKSAPLFGFEPKDQLVFEFQRAADYSASLALDPNRFFKLIRESNFAIPREGRNAGS